MIRMLVVDCAFAIRSERALCREVQVNLAYRWFYGLSIEDKILDHSPFSRVPHERFRESDMFRRVFERVLEARIAAGWSAAKGLLLMRASLSLTPTLQAFTPEECANYRISSGYRR
jgi:transposase